MQICVRNCDGLPTLRGCPDESPIVLSYLRNEKSLYPTITFAEWMNRINL